MSAAAVRAISAAYANLRSHTTNEVLVSARVLESLIRLATALAKLSTPPREVSKADVIEAHILLRCGLFGESEVEARATLKAKLPKKRKNVNYDDSESSDGDNDF